MRLFFSYSSVNLLRAATFVWTVAFVEGGGWVGLFISSIFIYLFIKLMKYNNILTYTKRIILPRHSLVPANSELCSY